ncbi:TonB-dependent receptor [Sphingomonas limnosediminicola]|uniref:TonB-dependent receptor n=1 Tax=Sphingomonas limnosediminicola TaxID=940133 RepID=A0ABP7LL02_9SPHN
MKLDFRQRLLTTTLLVGASMIASPAFAQDAPPATPSPPDNSATPTAPETTTPVEGQTVVPSTSATGENVKGSQDIVITGTRIPQPNLTSASPVTVLSSQEVKLQGTTRTEDLINSLPQSFASQGSNISNGSTGTATVNLRGLGSVRTLVLVNGRRLQPGDPRQGSVADINFIPSSLVKRVDVLTGGASSVYGADAVSGVVNFIMDTNYRGLKIDAQASTFMHNNDASDRILNADVARGYRPPHGMNINGGAQDVSAVFGAGFDDNRGSILAYATYRSQDPVLQATRDYSFCSLAARTAKQGGLGSGTPPRDFNCGGSATSATGTFFTNVGTFQTQGNQFVPGSTPFNFGPYNFYQRPDERYTLGAFAEYEISPGAKPYLEAMFMDDTSNAQIAPSGDFFNTTTLNCDNGALSAQQLSVICGAAVYNPADATNFTGNYLSTFGNLVGQGAIFGKDPDGSGPLKRPLLGFGVVGGVAPATQFTDLNGNTYNQGIAYIGRRNVEGGGRQDHLNHTAYRIVAGVRGDLLRGLSYDAYYQYGTTKLEQVYLNDFSVTRLRRALDIVAVDSTGAVVAPGTAGATAVCRSVTTGEDPNCVPYNIFATGGVTPAALAYLQTPGFQTGQVKEQIANANFTFEGGEYGLQTPWSDRGIGINVGGEYRKESLSTSVDTEFQTGDLAGQGGATLPVSGSFDVRELFTEVQVPIIEHSFIEEFSITGGYRYSDYKVAGNHFSTDTYKISAELAPVRDIRLRASYNRAVRAPNVVELFATQNVALGGTVDPCAGAAPTATAAQCANTGVTAAQYGTITANPANQYNALFGGNTELSPEKADSYTAGLVIQPRWIPGLAFTVDYFNIKIKNLISTIPYQTVINNCLTTGNALTCALIHRAPGNGSLWLSPNGYVDQRTINVGGESTKGFDLNGSYAHKFGGLGTMNVSYVGTILRKLDFDTGINPGTGGQDGVFDCAGLFGNTCGTPNPKYRHKLRLGFTLPNGLGLSGQWRYFSKVDDDVLSNDADLSGAAPAPADAKIPSQSYFDLALTARIGDRYNFRLGANNILDKDPPIVGGEVANAPFGNGNTYPQVYDALGRYIFAGVTIDF